MKRFKMTKLEMIRKYVESMFPVVRPAILRTPEDQLRDRGFDEASEFHQRRLLAILEGE